MSGAPVLTVSRLSAGYGGRVAAADVSFTLHRGEILCLVGESGCGKSTVLKALMAAPEVQVTAGEIALDGTELSALSPGARARLCREKMGLVFQSPAASFNPIRSYARQFREALKSHGKYARAAFGPAVAAAFAKVELQDWQQILRQCPYALSGGMNQRAALALALLLEQDILLCDEPTSALDATIQLQVARELKKLRDENGVSQIVVTHNLALAGFLADRIGVMYAGRLVELGAAGKLLHNPRHPYTRSLMVAIPGLDGRMPTGLSGQPPLEGPAETGCEFFGRCACASEDCRSRVYEPAQERDGHFAACCREGGAGR